MFAKKISRLAGIDLSEFDAWPRSWQTNKSSRVGVKRREQILEPETEATSGLV